MVVHSFHARTQETEASKSLQSEASVVPIVNSKSVRAT